MSSCLAVACERNTAIVTVTDRKWTNLYSSFEESLKAAYVAHGWIALVAGDNFAIAGEQVMHEMRDTLKDMAPGSISATQMTDVLNKAWNVAQQKIATTSVLGVFGLSMAEFMKSRDRFGDEVFVEMFREIQAMKQLGLEVLVCGFDDTGVPVMLVRGDSLGAAFDISRIGRAAIGSGHVHAEASLASHGFKPGCSMSEAVYHACAAKFISEQSDGVGDQTIVLCIKKDGSRCMVFGSDIDHIRGLWERETKPKMPTKEKITGLIDPILRQLWGNL